MAMEMGSKKQGTVRGRKWEVFCDVRQEADSQERKQSPRDEAEVCAKQFHVRAKSGPSPGPLSQRRPGKLLGGVGGGTHIRGPCLCSPPPVTAFTLSVSQQLKERNARIPQVSQPNSFTESQARCPLEP